jgi:hypothetical protein
MSDTTNTDTDNNLVENYDVPVAVTNPYEALPTKSAKIRAMARDGMTRYAIAKALGIRYQHVRNVLVTPIKGA